MSHRFLATSLSTILLVDDEPDMFSRYRIFLKGKDTKLM